MLFQIAVEEITSRYEQLCSAHNGKKRIAGGKADCFDRQ